MGFGLRGYRSRPRATTRAPCVVSTRYSHTPNWMRRRLIRAGMRSISLAVDVTNYVMLDLGQPMHAYDLDKIEGPIVVRRATKVRSSPHWTARIMT